MRVRICPRYCRSFWPRHTSFSRPTRCRNSMSSERAGRRPRRGGWRASAACQRDEVDERGKLEQDWAQYNAAQKSQCAGFAALDRAPSYVELLTCLEMAKQAQELPPDSKAETVGRK